MECFYLSDMDNNGVKYLPFSPFSTVLKKKPSELVPLSSRIFIASNPDRFDLLASRINPESTNNR